MKSIAAVAISESPGLTLPQIATAGISIASILLFFGATGLMSFLYRFIPLPVVRGVRLSQYLSFAFSSIKYIRYNQDFATSKFGNLRSWLGLDRLSLALFSILFIIILTGSGDSTDYGGDLTLVILLYYILSTGSGDSALKILRGDWKIGFVRAAILQIPLSVLNSVIDVCKLSTDLFPKKEVLATAVSVNVGAMNLVGCWLGAMASKDMNSKEKCFVMLVCAAVSLTGSSAAKTYTYRLWL